MKKKKIKRYRVGLNSECNAISFVSEPAIEVEAVALEKQDEEKQEVFFSSDEKYLFVSPIIIPNKDIYRNNGETEYYVNFGEDAIEKMSQNYLKDMLQKHITLQHNETVDEGVTLVESWVVYDEYQDKAHALGFNVPKGTWMGAFKVDSIDVWNRIKSGELKGVSVEAMVGLEEFEKQDTKQINFEDETMSGFLNEIRTMISDALHPQVVEEPKEPVEEKPVEGTETAVEEQKPVEVKDDIPEQKEEPVEPENKPVVEDNHLTELIENLRAELEALKGQNASLQDKVKELEKEPSAKPVTTTSNGNNGNSYSEWREAMKSMLG